MKKKEIIKQVYLLIKIYIVIVIQPLRQSIFVYLFSSSYKLNSFIYSFVIKNTHITLDSVAAWKEGR